MTVESTRVEVVRVGPDSTGRDQLAALRQGWVEENAGSPIDDPAYAESFRQWWSRERDRRLAWLARIDGAAVGMLSMAVFDRMPKPGSPPSRWGYLSNVFVLPGHRDGGIGRRLVDTALEHARCEAYTRVVLAPSERSRLFYGRAGFGPADNLLVHAMDRS